MSFRTATDEVRFAQDAERAALPVPPYEGADLDYGERPAWYAYGRGVPCGVRSFFDPKWIESPQALFDGSSAPRRHT